MTTNTINLERPRSRSRFTTQVVGGVKFDWAMIGVCTWLIVGGYSDGWAHNHLKLDNFFTPWHGVLYTGLLAVAVFLVGSFIRNRRLGYPLQYAMPAGYELSLLGVFLAFIAGIGDMFWHILFGIELNIDGALSPTHIGVTTAFVLVVSGPFRAAWQRSNSKQDLISLLPMLISLTFILSMVTILAQIAHPFVYLWPTSTSQASSSIQTLAVTSIILQTVILMGLVLLALRRWQLPFGSLTLVFTVNMAFLSFMQDHYDMILVAALAGLIADGFIWRFKPSITRTQELRTFAFITPVVLYLLYFLTLQFTLGIHWTIHLWLGSTFVAGITGFFLSYLLIPPKIPEEAVK